jgi:CRISPR-associated protein (TIGR03984 family)
MAEQAEDIALYVSRTKHGEIKRLDEALGGFVQGFGNDFPTETYAVLFAPGSCFLAVVSDAKFHSSNGEIDVGKEAVFEARVFNHAAELRWLNQANGDGPAVVLSRHNSKKFFGVVPEPFVTKVNEQEKKLVGAIEQSYLLWGESVGASLESGWTQFAEARIGSFFVPIAGVKANRKRRAQFMAIEYLGEYEDGNVAVAEERLTGIEIV